MVHSLRPWLFQDMVSELDRLVRLPGWTPYGLDSVEAVGQGDLTVEDDQATLILPLPGVSEDNLTVEVDDRTVRIEARREDPGLDDEEVILRERSYGELEQEVRLPWPVDTSAGEATLAKGILTLVFRRAPEAAPRQIKVQAG